MKKFSTGLNSIFISENITNWKWAFWTSRLFANVVVAKGDTVLVPLAQ